MTKRLRLILDAQVFVRRIDARFLRTSPRLSRATVLQSSLPIQNCNRSSVTCTSQRAPACCLPTETCCQDTHATPLAPTRRDTQSSPLRSPPTIGRGRRFRRGEAVGGRRHVQRLMRALGVVVGHHSSRAHPSGRRSTTTTGRRGRAGGAGTGRRTQRGDRRRAGQRRLHANLLRTRETATRWRFFGPSERKPQVDAVGRVALVAHAPPGLITASLSAPPSQHVLSGFFSRRARGTSRTGQDRRRPVVRHRLPG